MSISWSQSLALGYLFMGAGVTMCTFDGCANFCTLVTQVRTCSLSFYWLGQEFKCGNKPGLFVRAILKREFLENPKTSRYM